MYQNSINNNMSGNEPAYYNLVVVLDLCLVPLFWINRIVTLLLFRDANRFPTRRVSLKVYCKLEIHGNGNGGISCAPLLPVNLGSFWLLPEDSAMS
jgi:hypothetical protein